LDRLYSRQNLDGGWGWWRDYSDLQVSAYVALGLLEAQQNDFVIREDALQRSLDYLSLTLREDLATGARTSSHAMALYVLTRAGQPWPEGVVDTLYTARDKLGVTGQAYLAMALGISDDADRRVKSLLDNLRGLAEVTATGAHWEDANGAAWVTDVRATAVVLDALVKLDPQDSLIPQAVRWLMVAREGDRWTTTQETSWTLIALTDFMVSSGDLTSRYSWGVALNEVALGSGQVDGSSLREVSEIYLGLSDNPAEGLIKDAPNALEIAHGEGEGALYYTAHLALYQSVANLKAESRGITIQRQYCVADRAGSGELQAPCVPVDSAQPGDLVEVRLTLVVPQTRYYLVVEDPYPAGMEPIDLTLLTESQNLPGTTVSFEGEDLQWVNPFERHHRELRDEKAVFFAQAIPAGTYQLSYHVRAAIPGTYNVLPAQAFEMYFPEVRGHTGGTIFQIKR